MADGAALCYKTICTEGSNVLGTYAHSELTLHTHSLAKYVECLSGGDLDGVGSLMLSSAQKLAASGAEVLIYPDNTIHRALPAILKLSPLPWLHIAEIVPRSASGRGFKKVGITEIEWLVDSDVYPTCLKQSGIVFARPFDEDRIKIDRIIMTDLVCGDFRPTSIKSFQRIFNQLEQQKCDAVILGCTEIPSIMSDANSPLPTLDSTRLLALAALCYAIDQSDQI